MKEKMKKSRSVFYIAVTHWLTSAFVVPLILGILATILIGLILSTLNIVDTNSSIFITISAIYVILITPLIYWLGTMYGAKYINKTYVVKDSKEIAKTATLIVVILGGGFRLFQFLSTGNLKYEYIGFILAVIVFYFTSLKYVKTDNQPSDNL